MQRCHFLDEIGQKLTNSSFKFNVMTLSYHGGGDRSIVEAEAMSQPDESPPRRSRDSPSPKTSTIPRSASFTPGAPTIGIATFEQLLRGGGGEHWSSRWPWNSSTAVSSSSCTTSPVIAGKDWDPEETENHNHNHKNSPSVLARVKERWRRVCRRSSLDLNNTPPWGVSLDDIDDHLCEDETNQSIFHTTEY